MCVRLVQAELLRRHVLDLQHTLLTVERRGVVCRSPHLPIGARVVVVKRSSGSLSEGVVGHQALRDGGTQGRGLLPACATPWL
jgi:hypothetical protein